jgi:hypothetical protein
VPELEPVYSAFWDLNTERPGLDRHIPHMVILSYGRMYGYGQTVDELKWFVDLIKALDFCYLEWLSDKRKEEQRKADRKNKRKSKHK